MYLPKAQKRLAPGYTCFNERSKKKYIRQLHSARVFLIGLDEGFYCQVLDRIIPNFKYLWVYEIMALEDIFFSYALPYSSSSVLGPTMTEVKFGFDAMTIEPDSNYKWPSNLI